MENIIQTEATVGQTGAQPTNETTTLSAENVTAFMQQNPSIFKTVLEQDFAKQIIQPKLDSHFTKSLDTWKANNLEGLVNAKVAELYPEETPENKQIRQLQQQMNQMQAEKRMSELEVIKRDVLASENIQTSFSKFITGDSEEAIKANAVELKTLLSGQVQQGVEERFKQQSHTPQTQNHNTSNTGVDVEEFKKMPVSEKSKLKKENPSLYEQYAEALLNG